MCMQYAIMGSVSIGFTPKARAAWARASDIDGAAMGVFDR